MGHRVKNFEDFSAKYINETNFILDQSILSDVNLQDKINNGYKSFFIGSDQVWNLNGSDFPEFYFLPFVDSKKRNSFAASFGVETIDHQYIEKYKQGIAGLNAISVREMSGKKIVKELTCRECDVLLDPVFLLSVKSWRQLETRPNLSMNHSERYILTYFLGHMARKYRKILYKFAKEQELKIISLNDFTSEEYYSVSPNDFLSLIDSASFVLTDSFHGVAFSIIFQRPFMVVDRIDKFKSMSTRISSILEAFGLSDRFNKLSPREINTTDWMNIEVKGLQKVIENNAIKANSFVKKSLS
nr:polysaccharide pyruvyl transferase family protein [Levilactobacillus brevis]